VFDATAGEWTQLSKVETSDLVQADEHLDRWVLEHYGDQFEVIKPA